MAPHPPRRPVTAASRGAGVTLAAALLAGCGSEPPPGGQPQAYVAIGDSYSAAPLNPEQADAACLRSTNNYASRLARTLAVPLTDVTCAGATTGDVGGEQQIPGSRGGGSVEPQVEAVTDETDLVTIGLGGNDDGLFVTMVERCLTPESTARRCVSSLARTGDESDFRQAGRSVRRVVAQVRDRAAAGVRIVLVDYPRFVSSARPCAPLAGVPQESLAAVADAQRRLNRTLALAAEESGALFLDLEQPSVDHDLCSDDSWLDDGTTRSGRALRWHPFPAEQAAVAGMLHRLLLTVDR